MMQKPCSAHFKVRPDVADGSGLVTTGSEVLDGDKL